MNSKTFRGYDFSINFLQSEIISEIMFRNKV